MDLRDATGGLRGAVGFLTRFPVRANERDWQRFTALPVAFPSVGYLIGGVVALPFLVGGPETTVALAYLFVLLLVVGIPHFDGVADLGDAAAAHGRTDRRDVLKDTKTGVGAIIAVTIVIVGLALAAIELAGAPLVTAVGIIIAAEVGAKLGMATVACLGTASHEGLGSQFTRSAEPALLVGPAVVALPVALLVSPFPVGIAAIVAGPVVALVLVRWANQRLGGVNGDVFGATNEFGRLIGLHAGVIVWTLS